MGTMWEVEKEGCNSWGTLWYCDAILDKKTIKSIQTLEEILSFATKKSMTTSLKWLYVLL